jgi:hypothetical protein
VLTKNAVAIACLRWSVDYYLDCCWKRREGRGNHCLDGDLFYCKDEEKEVEMIFDAEDFAVVIKTELWQEDCVSNGAEKFE